MIAPVFIDICTKAPIQLYISCTLYRSPLIELFFYYYHLELALITKTQNIKRKTCLRQLYISYPVDEPQLFIINFLCLFLFILFQLLLYLFLSFAFTFFLTVVLYEQLNFVSICQADSIHVFLDHQ